MSSNRRVFVLAALSGLLPLFAGCAEANPESERPGEPQTPAPETMTAPRAAQASDAGDVRPAVVFLGNSLTAGLGVDPRDAYPALIQTAIDAAGLEFRVVNAGVSGETTAGGLARIHWVLEQQPAVLLIALGGNDALRGVPAEVVRQNLRGIVDATRQATPDTEIVIAGMIAPPNLGRPYGDAFAAVFPDVAESVGATLVPFLLVGVAADPDLNQPDGIHPTAEGQQIIASTVWAHLEPVLRSLTTDGASRR
jgi:acyl-CoA thioesterase-1